MRIREINISSQPSTYEPPVSGVIGKWKTVDLGLNFENDGLRAKVRLLQEKKKLN